MGNCDCCGENRKLYPALYQGKDANVCHECLKITDKEWDAFNERVIAAQETLITERYGKEASKAANYGYGQSDFKDGSIDLATKVYLPEGSMILVTMVRKLAIVNHEWRTERQDGHPQIRYSAHPHR